MEDLGLEFLSVYDGRFNYREGHRVSVMISLPLNSFMCNNLVCYAISWRHLVSNN